MEFDTLYIGVCYRCCEIAIGTKNSSFISLPIMFFKHDKSIVENVFFPTINVFERKLLALSSHWDPPIYTKEKWSNIPECDLVTCAIVPRFVLKI